MTVIGDIPITVLTDENPLFFLSQQEPIYWSIREVLKQNYRHLYETQILEVGSVLGYLTYALQKEGYCHTKGLDIAQEAVDIANQKYGKYYICADIYEYAIQNENSYDIVILTEVIEHLNNPLSFTRSLLQILKPNGIIILTTPNIDFFDFRKSWSTDLPPVHCWWFSEKSLSFIASQLNTTIDFLDFTKYYKNKPRKISKKFKNTVEFSSQFHRFDSEWNIITPPVYNHKVYLKRLKYNPFFKPLYFQVLKWYLKLCYYFPCFSLQKYYCISGKKTSSLCGVITKKTTY